MSELESCPTCGALPCDQVLALRSNPQPGSEGWRLVPVELTPDMRMSAILSGAVENESGVSSFFPGKAWSAMLAASPTPPTAQPGEVERLRAYAASCERTTQDMIATTAKHFAEVERLRSELKQAQLERDDALDRVDELEKDAEIVSVEFEKDCWVAMRSLLQQVGWDDFSEGVTADMAREIVSDEIKRLTALTPSESGEAGPQWTCTRCGRDEIDARANGCTRGPCPMVPR